MSTKNKLSNALDELIAPPIKETNPKSVNNDLIKKEKYDNLLAVKLKPSQKDKLESHFEKKGLSLSSGVRMVILNYLEEKNI